MAKNIMNNVLCLLLILPPPLFLWETLKFLFEAVDYLVTFDQLSCLKVNIIYFVILCLLQKLFET